MKNFGKIDIDKALMKVSLATFAAVGSASGHIWFAGLAAIPAAFLSAYDILRTESDTKRSLHEQNLELPVPSWWGSDTRSWEGLCVEISMCLPRVIQQIPEQLRSMQVVGTRAIILQNFIDLLMKEHLTWVSSEEEQRKVAEFVAEPILQRADELLKPVIQQIQHDALLVDVNTTALNTGAIIQKLEKIHEELRKQPEPFLPTRKQAEDKGTTQHRPITETLWNVPYNRNPFFTGREMILAQLHTALTLREQPIAISQPQAISGLGGIGKTQLAIEYAYRYRADYSAVLWVRAESADLLVSDYLTLAALLNLPECNEQEQPKIVNAVRRWFDTHQGWLLILDNADHLDTIRAFLPSSDKGHVLLTTRAFSTGTVAGRIELETMTVEEGMLFLLRRVKYIQRNTPLESVPENMRSQARAIIEMMDALPLALDQAGAYIEETRSSLSGYSQLYQMRHQRLLHMRGQDAAGHPEPVATTWSLSFEKIEQANSAATELLCLLAFLHPDAIPESIVVEGASALDPVLRSVVSDEIDFNVALGELHKYSLIKRDPEEKLIAIHRLVQAVLQDTLKEVERRRWAERAVLVVNAAFPASEHGTWPQRERLLPHALLAAHYIETDHIIREEAGRLLHETATYLKDRARYTEAEPLYQQAVRIWEQQLEPEHSAMAASLDGLAILYREQGKYAEAEPLYQRALHIREQQLEPEHPDVAVSLNGLALLYYQQGKYTEAEPLFLRALRIWEQQLGETHPLVAKALNNLAILYREQGKYAEAEPLYQRALHIWEQQPGPEHPDVAFALNNLAILYYEQGRYVESEPFFQRALHIWEQQLGETHPLVAYALNNLAEYYLKQGKYTEAEPLYQRALHIWEQQPGLEHPDATYPLDGLATLYREQGKYAEAEPLYRRALRIWEQQPGPEHPDIAYALNNLANLYYKQGRYAEAEPLYWRALRIREQRNGPQHLETAEVLHDFAFFQETQGNTQEAISLYQRALAIRERALGTPHPKTTETRKRFIALLHIMDQHEEAVQLEVAQSEPRMSEEELKAQPEE